MHHPSPWPSPPGIEVSFWLTPARPRHRYMSSTAENITIPMFSCKFTRHQPSKITWESFQTWKLQKKRITKPQTQRPQPTREDATRERIFLEWPGSQSCISFLLSRIFILAGVAKGMVIKNKKGWQMQQGWHNTVLKGMNMDEPWCLLLLEDVVSTEWHWSGWMLAVGPWWRLSMAVLHSFNFSPCCVKTESIHSRTMPEEIVKAILAGRFSVKRCDFPALV